MSSAIFIADIAARASTLWERLAEPATPQPAPDAARADKRLELWRRIAAGGDTTVFARRLAWDGLTHEAVYEALGPRRWPADRPLPAWTDTLLDMVRAASTEFGALTRADAGARMPFLSPEYAFPFEETVCPFVVAARERLATISGSGPRRLSPAAQAGLDRSLLRALCFTASPTLLVEFSAFRTSKRWSLATSLGLVGVGSERTLYDEFIVSLFRGGWTRIFERYPVLARRMATTVDLWIETTAEFMDRLERDHPTLQQVFGDDRDIGDVVALRPDLSDPHGGRRSVVGVTFASGLKLIYKPKDLRIEQAFGRFASWIQARDPSLDVRTYTIVDRSSYGWAEFVEARPCADRAAAARFYRRAGMLVCLVYVLEGTDGSQDNLIASGDHPVLIDLETLLHHRVRRPTDRARAADAAHEQWVHSVLHTAMLPVWELRADRRVAIDRTGLGGLGDHGTVPGRKWVRVNTDGIALERGPIVIGRKANIPTVDGQPMPAAGHVAEIVDGFRQMYRFLAGAKDALLAADGPLDEFSRQRVRFIHRPTDVYYTGFDVLHDPRHLRDGVDQSIQLEWLARPFTRFSERPQLWPLVQAERRALERGDIPRFTASASENAVDVGSGVRIEACFDEPSFTLLRERIALLGDGDLARQIAFIEGAFFAHRAHEPAATELDAGTATAPAGLRSTGVDNLETGPAVETPRLTPLGSGQWLEHAAAIAHELRRTSISGDDGSAAWIAPHLDVRSDRFHFSPLEDDLYAGTSGMAIFLAAADRAFGGCRQLALGALASLRRSVRSANTEFAARAGLGGAAGLGGLIYGLATVGGLLGEEALYADAARLAALITPEIVATDDRLDVLGGSAGAILGLLALHAVTGDASLIERAQLCGDHLVANRSATTTGSRAWRTLDGRHLTGISHGAAGIALALLRLHDHSRDRALHDAAAEAVRYEQQVFSPEAGNWPDYRVGDPPAFPVRWCHGAAGIGLARIGGLSSLDTEAVRSDIDIALTKTAAVVDAGTDHVCCGNMGLAEVLLVGGQRLRRTALIDAALMRAAQVTERARRRGSYMLHPQLPATLINPAFFQGLAGIGYTFLCLADPDRLPSVLLFEPMRSARPSDQIKSFHHEAHEEHEGSP